MPKKVPIYSARDEMQAAFLVQVLASHEIEATLTGGTLAALAGYLPATYGNPQVWVDQDDLDRARPIVEQFERSRRAPRGAEDLANAWVCASCGELIEAQFTDCWSCQAPRPPGEGANADAGAQAQATVERPPADPHIRTDLKCVRCAYNLRNLPVDRLCPECAHPAFASLLQTMQSQQDWSLEHERELTLCLDYIEAQIGFPIEAIAYVTQMWPRAVERAGAAGVGIAEGTPDDDAIAEALRDLAVDFFGDPLMAARAMQRWNLGSGASLRRLRESLDAFNFM